MGELILRNNTIGDSYQYKLQGIGEEPIADDHLVIDCRARWKTSAVLHVRNIFKHKAVTYKVECDLSGVSGKPCLMLTPQFLVVLPFETFAVCLLASSSLLFERDQVLGVI